jgi:hypothetical protein
MLTAKRKRFWAFLEELRLIKLADLTDRVGGWR